MPHGVSFSYLDLLGQSLRMTVRELLPRGAHLVPTDVVDDGQVPNLLLPRGEMPAELQIGDSLSVFIYLDSEDRPIATTLKPKVELGQVAFLEVMDKAPFGVFVDWGLKKQLLVPFAEQICEMGLGQRYAVGLMRDESGRLAGTMRVSELLKKKSSYRLDEWVLGEAWRNEPQVGLFIILERTYIALLRADEPHRLRRGEAARFRISNVLADGKVELSLRRLAVEELGADAARVLELLAQPNAPKFGDHSDPNQVRAYFNLSKKVFKRAVGRLLKQGTVCIDDQGHVVVKQVGSD